MTATPEQIAQKWATNLGGASQAIKDGVAAVRTAPGQAAAAQKQVWAANVAASQDKWARRVASVSLQDWQTAMTDKGINRIASGATAAQGKFGSFMGQLLPYIDRVNGSLPARGNLEQNIARMTTFVRGMSQFKRQ